MDHYDLSAPRLDAKALRHAHQSLLDAASPDDRADRLLEMALGRAQALLAPGARERERSIHAQLARLGSRAPLWGHPQHAQALDRHLLTHPFEGPGLEWPDAIEPLAGPASPQDRLEAFWRAQARKDFATRARRFIGGPLLSDPLLLGLLRRCPPSRSVELIDSLLLLACCGLDPLSASGLARLGADPTRLAPASLAPRARRDRLNALGALLRRDSAQPLDQPFRSQGQLSMLHDAPLAQAARLMILLTPCASRPALLGLRPPGSRSVRPSSDPLLVCAERGLHTCASLLISMGASAEALLTADVSALSAARQSSLRALGSAWEAQRLSQSAAAPQERPPSRRPSL